MNIETHEEITSFEVVRLVETVGPDVMGIVFDTGNVLQRGEHPIRAAHRVAPYVRQTHLKDAFLAFGKDGLLDYQLRPLGEGVVDFYQLVPILAAANRTLNLTIENEDSYEDRPRPVARKVVEIFDPRWLENHPDLTLEEYAAYLEMVQTYSKRIASGEIPDHDTYARQPYGFGEAVSFVRTSGKHLHAVCDAAGLS
jgi:hypothetical protein